jgi:hypothetical protein
MTLLQKRESSSVALFMSVVLCLTVVATMPEITHAQAPANDIPQKFQPKSPNEPALRLAVPAGKSRTVIARGANGTEGIALIEFNLLSNSDSSGTAPLANLSTRGNIGTGDNILIAGVVIQGSGTKRVLVTGRGASVPVSGNIANTQLRVVNQATKQVIASSDDYSSESQNAAIRAAGKARTIVDSDAAVILDLAAGAYTVLVSGTGEAKGVGIVEIFDIDPASSARIVNLSTRGRVGTGDNVMIGGLIAGGNSGEFAGVITRVTSPSSVAYDRDAWLADPKITVFDGPNKVLENDNWTNQGLAPAVLNATSVRLIDENLTLNIAENGSDWYVVLDEGQNSQLTDGDFGTLTYTASGDTGFLSYKDSDGDKGRAELKFTSNSEGSYEILDANSDKFTGRFTVIDTSQPKAPSSIAGKSIRFNISSGSGLFATDGTFVVNISDNGKEYSSVVESGNAAGSNGTVNYTYSGNQGFGNLMGQINGSDFGLDSKITLTFSSDKSGTFLQTSATLNSSQTGSFTDVTP